MKKFLLFVLCVMSSQLLMAKTVGPLIKTQWNQTDPYNLMCPTIDGQHCLTSCGATALAQLCYYYKWPEQSNCQGYYRINGDNNSHDVELNSQYEYDKMLLTYDENSSEESKMAVALLMRDVASLGTVFGLTESTSPWTGYLAERFGYDDGITHLPIGYFSKEDLVKIIRSELDAGRPVYLGGSNGSAGHTFICDGYNDDTNEYHFNYGWGGLHDAWSTLENCLFPVNMEIDFNIKKDEGGKPGFALCSNVDFKWLGGNKLYGNYKFDSYFQHELKPQIALAVENTTTHEVQYFYLYDKEPSDPNAVELMWDFDEDLADGSYILYPVGHGKELNTAWQKAYFRDLCQKEVTLTVKDGVKTFTNSSLNDPVREGAVDVDGYCYELNEETLTATFTYRNDKYACYAGDVVIPETITYNQKTYTVTAIGREAFKDCHYLDDVLIAKTVTEIGWGAFQSAIARKISFAKDSQLKTIGDYAFYSIELDEIILPEGLEVIGNDSFVFAKIGSVTIPSTVTTWGGWCFHTHSLICVHVNSTTPPVMEEPPFTSNDNDFVESFIGPFGIQSSVLYVPAGTKALYAQADVWKDFGFILEPGDDDSFVSQIKLGGVEIDGIHYWINGAKGIAGAARVNQEVKEARFKNTIKMGDKTLTVKKILNACINGTNHDLVVIPASVEVMEPQCINGSTLGRLEFEEGSHLKTIEKNGINFLYLGSPLVFPEGLENLGTLSMPGVEDLTIPASVTNLEGDYYLHGIKHLRVSWPTPPVVSNLFSESQFIPANSLELNKATLHVPVGTKELYAQAEGWKLFPYIVEGDDDYVEELKGDVDGNGVVEEYDRGLLVQIIMGVMKPDEATLKRADLNNDSHVNAADLVLLNAILNK